MFDEVISLGYYCGTAAAMSKFGLRSFSGPFDWMFTKSLPGVLDFLERDFADWLRLENLTYDYDEGFGKRLLRDHTHKIIYNHDDMESFPEGLEKVRQKYEKHINNYLKIRGVTLLFARG